eukprot:scaffold54032_cov20-Tisochrysis_lutea.AAC.2
MSRACTSMTTRAPIVARSNAVRLPRTNLTCTSNPCATKSHVPPLVATEHPVPMLAKQCIMLLCTIQAWTCRESSNCRPCNDF